MDAMALLCTLHADGPVSLRRLRESGCASFDDLASLAPERAAQILAISPSAARRLLRMAEGLRERVGDEILEREEVLHPAAKAANVDEMAAGTAPSVAVSNGGAEASEESPGTVAECDRALVERVVERWREREQDAEASSVAPAFAAAFEPASDLCPGVIDGLDEAQRGVLLEAGFNTLDDVAEGDATEIARTCGISYSQVRRIQFLARRVLAARADAGEPVGELVPTAPPAAREQRAPEKISLAFPPAPGPRVTTAPTETPAPAVTQEGAGGPFA
ncbi:MAG: helix-hairpin-helix domain-containing protein [Planctomycetota bacterium]|nr:helix-hairpin-helix domain-containing protein [Planctomycetota bacterium]